MKTFRCKVCGYIYEGDELPTDFVCTLCNKGVEDFEEVQEAPAAGGDNRLKGTKTAENLATSFAGESQARNKYTYFAGVARKEGYEQIAAIFEQTANNEKEHAKQVQVIEINHTKEYEELSISSTAEHVRAYIKVQDGCNQFCTYCIIPFARGRVRSRKIEEVLSEVETLAAKGYKEVVLTGLRTTGFRKSC